MIRMIQGDSDYMDDSDDSDDSEAQDEDSIVLPDVPVAVGPGRDKVRRQLIALLDEEIKAADAAYRSRRRAVLRAKLPDFRDRAIPPKLEESRIVFRMEEASFRQVSRLSDLLLKLKAQRQWQNHSEDVGTTHDVVDNKGSAPEIDGVYEGKK